MFRFGSWLRDYWSGGLPFAFSFFAVGLGVLAFVRVLKFALAEAITPLVVWSVGPYIGLFSLLFYFAILLVIFSWWLVGLWRSIRRHANNGPFVGTIALRTVVLGIATIVAASYAFWVPAQIADAVSNVREDPQWGPRWISLNTILGRIVVHGYLTRSQVSGLEREIAALPGVRTVELDSDGGRLEAARRMAEVVRAHHLDTLVSKECDSACTLVFLAGNRRLLGRNARLGFHTASAGGQPLMTTDAALVEEATRSGVSEQFLRKAYSVPANEMWYPSIRELVAAKVATGISA
jgi:hypothetical protein